MEETAYKLLSELKEEDKKVLLENPDYSLHHFGFGLYIRNQYIHGKDLDFFFVQADDLSHDVFEELIRLLKEEAEIC